MPAAPQATLFRIVRWFLAIAVLSLALGAFASAPKAAGNETTQSPAPIQNAPEAQGKPSLGEKTETPIEWANWALVAVGLLTFLAVWIQAREAARATKAVERNVDAFVKSQRPIIACDPHGNPLSDLMDAVPRVRLGLTNKGQTTAYGCLHEAWIEFLPRVPGRDRPLLASREIFPAIIFVVLGLIRPISR